MENNTISELKKANSKLENAIRNIKNLNVDLEISQQNRKYILKENELLIEQNRKNINYLTAHINYGFIL